MGNKNFQTVAIRPLVGASEQSPEVAECINLRTTISGDALEVIGRPQKISDDPTLPFCVVSHPSVGRIMFVAANQMFTARYFDETPQREIAVGSFNGEFRCAVSTSDSRVVVMTSAGPETILISDRGECRLATHPNRFPPLRFSVFDEMTISEPIEAETLRGDYSDRPSQLSDDDAARLTADALAAYDRLSRLAAGASLALQPTLARYKLYGPGDELLYVSPAVLLGPSTGSQGAHELSCRLEAGCSRRASTNLGVSVFKMRLQTIDNFLTGPTDEVHRLVVETSLPAHPFDFGGLCSNAIDRHPDSTGILRFFMPGVSVGMVASANAATARLAAMAAAGDATFRPALTVIYPFREGSAVDFVVPPVTLGSPLADVKAIEHSMSTNHVPRALPASLCLPPHRFTAACGDIGGGRVIWGDISVLPFSGYRPELFALSTTDADWSASVTVEMADGRLVAASALGRHAAPERFSPLLVYPSADAVKMTVTMRRGSDSYSREFPLTPSADGTYAYYFDRSSQPITLQPTSEPYAIPTQSAPARTFPSAIVNCSAASPLVALDGVEVSSSRVMAVKGVARRNRSWDYLRRRFYIFSCTGIHLANLANDGGLLPLLECYPEGIADASAVAVTTDPDYHLACVAGHRLICFNQQKVKIIESATDAARLAWDTVDSELWMADAEGNLQAMQGLGGMRYNVGGIRSDAMFSTPGGVLLTTDDGLRFTGLDREESAVPFGYVYLSPTPRLGSSLRLPKLVAAEVALHAEDIDCDFEISDAQPDSRTGPKTTRVRLAGCFHNRVPVRLIPIGALGIKLALRGTAQPGTRLSGFRLNYRRS